jgi:uncharacterized SAM-binding protein YcdF (DUF218 family)
MFRCSYPKLLKKTLLVAMALYLMALVFFSLSSLSLNQKAKKKLEHFTPDLISVFTGHSGRIHLALNLAKKFPQSTVLITGVHKDNTPEKIAKSFKLKNTSRVVEVDYTATNTVENGISTLRYIRQNPQLKNILIVSHDYHLLRIAHIMKKLKLQSDHITIEFLGHKTDYFKLRSIKIVSKEIIKLIRTWFLSLFWGIN